MTADLASGQARDVTAAACEQPLDPAGTWIAEVLRSADRRLSEVRRNVPDAGGLVIASDHESARAYAARLTELTGQQPVVVLSDDPRASERIESFASSGQRWLVAVRMVSEGVDIPRLMVGVYATSTGTPLFFAQAVGRFVRARRAGETASVFLPSVPSLLPTLGRWRPNVTTCCAAATTTNGWRSWSEPRPVRMSCRVFRPSPARRPSTGCSSTAANSIPSCDHRSMRTTTSWASRPAGRGSGGRTAAFASTFGGRTLRRSSPTGRGRMR